MPESSPIALRKLLALRKFPLLAAVELAELAVIAENLVDASFPAGATVALPPSRLPALHLVVDGRIEMRSPGPGLAVRAWGQHQAFGTLEVLAGRSLGAEAIAVIDTRTLRLSASDLGEILEDSFGLLTATIRDLATRLVAAGGWPAQASGPPASRPGPLDLVERMIVLRHQLPLLSTRLEPLAILAHAAHEQRWPAGAMIGRAGDPVHDVSIILEGTVDPDRGSDVLGAGGVIGVLEALGRLPHRSTITARIPTRGLRIPCAAILDMLEDHTDLGRSIVRTLAGALLDVVDQPHAAHPSTN